MFLLLAALAFGGSMLVRWWLNRTYSKWRQVPNAVGANGAQVARFILAKNNLQHVRLEASKGELSDHYVPSQDLLRLSEPIHAESTVAALAVAAHEVGHAIQDAENYPPLKWKASLMPMAMAGNNIGMMMALGGGLLGASAMVDMGLLLFAVALLMPVLTLPIEFDASKRALAELERAGLVDQRDYDGAKSMLTAAALTYVAGATTSLAMAAFILLRFIRR